MVVRGLRQRDYRSQLPVAPPPHPPGSDVHDNYVTPVSRDRGALRSSNVVERRQIARGVLTPGREGSGPGGRSLRREARCSRARRTSETIGSHGLRRVSGVETFVIRMWLPDRPGALGQVASRIGAVRGDVVGIDILERDGGQAVDELVVELPDGALVDLLVAEVRQVDGVAVEEVRPVADALHDPRLDALEAAAQLVGAD